MSDYKYVHHNICKGGKATKEVDGITYCYGRIDPMYEDVVYDDMCKNCPILYANNEEKISNWIKEQEHEHID